MEPRLLHIYPHEPYTYIHEVLKESRASKEVGGKTISYNTASFFFYILIGTIERARQSGDIVKIKNETTQIASKQS